MSILRRAVRAPAYHGTGRRAPAGRLAAFAAAWLLAAGAGGCSMSMQLEDFFPSRGEAADVTGSVGEKGAKQAGTAEAISSADWNLATDALREALGQKEDGASIPWQNPNTGSRGTVTPVASAYVQDGFPCRNFLASHVSKGGESWFEGTACRIHRGEWEIRSRRPLEKS